jgi:uncharacterized protein YbjQ (UPF0145 family)
MKNPILLCLLVMSFLITSCGAYVPTYVGASYPATQNIDTYYSARDVKQNYKVIGHFAIKTPDWKNYPEKAKQDILADAKKQGADAVIFSAIDYQEKESSTITIKAEAIRYDK